MQTLEDQMSDAYIVEDETPQEEIIHQQHGFENKDWFWLLMMLVAQVVTWYGMKTHVGFRFEGIELPIVIGLILVVQTIFFALYRFTESFEIESYLVLFHLLISGSIILFVSYLAWPYTFEIALFFLPLVLIAYKKTLFSGKLLICFLGATGYLIVLLLQISHMWMKELTDFELGTLFWKWAVYGWLMVAATLFSHYCATMSKQLSSKESQLHDAMLMINQLTIHDKLTGLYNQRFIMQQLQKQKQIADRGKYSFVLGLLAIDHCQELRESHSQAAADAVIKAVADTVDQHIRHLDYCGRWTDTSFAVVLENTEAEKTKAVFERICQSVADHSFYGFGIDRDVSLSVGVTQYSCIEEWQATMDRAKSALLEARNKGSGQVVVQMARSRQVELVRDHHQRLNVNN